LVVKISREWSSQTVEIDFSCIRQQVCLRATEIFEIMSRLKKSNKNSSNN